MAEVARKFPTEPTAGPQPVEVTEGRRAGREVYPGQEGYQGYRVLRTAYTIAPIVAGVDKFTEFLVNWDQYLAPPISRMLGGASHTFMLVVGGIEILAGIGVAIRPRIFGFVVSAWLGAIVINLLIGGEYYDIALRDLGLSMGAFALGRMAQQYEGRKRRTYGQPRSVAAA